jgi:predicted DNA-binding transcriptional regulator
MRIEENFADCKHVGTVKIVCALNGIAMSESEAQKLTNLVVSNNKFFVFIGKSGLDILEMRERSELLAKIVSARVRRGIVLFFHDGAIREITRKDTPYIWQTVAPKKVIERDDREIIPVKKRTIFEEAMNEQPRKKYRNWGFPRTMQANEAMYRFIHI